MTCRDYAEEFRKKNYHFEIDNKEISGRYTILEGINIKGEKERFQQVGWLDMEAAAEIGNELVKLKGSLEIKIIKKDTTLIFSYDCE